MSKNLYIFLRCKEHYSDPDVYPIHRIIHADNAEEATDIVALFDIDVERFHESVKLSGLADQEEHVKEYFEQTFIEARYLAKARYQVVFVPQSDIQNAAAAFHRDSRLYVLYDKYRHPENYPR
jgi:hypothetical protein